MSVDQEQMTQDAPILPQGWEWAKLGAMCETTSGGTPSRGVKEFYGGNIPWLKSGELKNQTIYSAEESITEEGLGHSSAKIFPKGTLLIALYGATVGKLGILGINAATNQAICAISVPTQLPLKFFFWYLDYNRDRFLNLRQGGAQPNISQGLVNQLSVPLPPLPEQRRIVDKIEELFTKLDAGIESLKKAQAQLKQYRQSVLKAAVEGKLTEEWRAAHKDELEPASVLLERIQKERREKWEAEQLESFAAKGKTPKDDKWKGKYKGTAVPDIEELPQLNDVWIWAMVEQLASAEPNSITDGPFGSNLKTAHYTESGPRVVRLQNIAPYRFVDEEAHISEEHFRKLEKHSVYPGDIVIASLGYPAARACPIPSWLGNAIVKADCIRFSPSKHIIGTYVLYALNSTPTQKRTESIVHGVGRPRLGLGGIRRIAVPLPPQKEQLQIVEAVEFHLSIADEVETTIAAELGRAERLRQSILKRAFAGKLVPQDPNDESASILLERIKAEKAVKEAENKRARKSKAKPKK